ncbi:protein mono-ADP-ribosyltransferase PARP14-like isoform X2 [Thalassophryne amazonica]|uniref:protein mono-ADP-ribosyltransferase PARP14-like isoform X2 n=1 Tax=Thalassophryne amazonica TaxID=390379 RepID=UPI0014715790|nr:protein mono-ADP-ribosyltransferase PARP14-like isoform X2 [Thalassophryne amazonica]
MNPQTSKAVTEPSACQEGQTLKKKIAYFEKIQHTDATANKEAHIQRRHTSSSSAVSVSNPVPSSTASDLEATVATQGDPRVTNMQSAAPGPPDLHREEETLTEANTYENLKDLLVGVCDTAALSATATIDEPLVDNGENADQLEEQPYYCQVNQAEINQLLQLPFPEMVDCFDQILGLIGMEQPAVTLQPAHDPYPHVLVSGPNSLVQDTLQALESALASLTSDKLVLDGPWAQWYFQADGKMSKKLVESSCRVLILENLGSCSKSTEIDPNMDTTTVRRTQSCTNVQHSRPATVERSNTFTTGTSSMAINKTSLQVKLGDIADEQVDVLVAPMINKKLTSTQISKCLWDKDALIRTKFDNTAKKRALAPGDVLQLDGFMTLGCSKIYFIECLPWDGARGQSVQVLGDALKKCLDLCEEEGWHSVAFPIIGPGAALKFPLTEAIQVLTDRISQFASSAVCSCVSTIRIVIKPDYPNLDECYHEVYRCLNLNKNNQAIFKSITGDLDNITITVGDGVKLHLVFGDISNETTDVVVNTTNFSDFNTDVCRAILAKAGPQVQAELKAAKKKDGDIFVTSPGMFPCKAILHASGKRDKGIIKQLVSDIIYSCETIKVNSVAIPAICAGAGELQPEVVADTIFQGVQSSTFSSKLHWLSNIRLILFKVNVFLAFKEKAMQMFPAAVITTESVPQSAPAPERQRSPSSTLEPNSQQSIFLILGRCKNDVDNAMMQTKQLYQNQLSTATLRNDDFTGLTEDDINELTEMIEDTGLHVDELQSSEGEWTVSGLKDDIIKVRQMIHNKVQATLKKGMKKKEEDTLYNRVAWCMMGRGNSWERLPKVANHSLENNDVSRGIVDGQGILWTVDLEKMVVQTTGKTRKLKRLESLPAFTPPLYWDNMDAGEDLKVIQLQESSAEYYKVREAFHKTMTKQIIKIERIQNVDLRRAYKVQKKRISNKNVHLKAGGELLLYHGTTEGNSKSIMKTGFNRRYAGQNGTSYGQGTYFAVDASYSANPAYSKPAAGGSQLMFVVRVLAGTYTLGNKDMKVLPPRNPQQPHDLYDSAVNNLDNPTMFVVFHDDQAYPDYLITFK